MQILKPESSRPTAPPEQFHRLLWDFLWGQRSPFMQLITGPGHDLGNCIHMSFTINLHVVLCIACLFCFSAVKLIWGHQKEKKNTTL